MFLFAVFIFRFSMLHQNAVFHMLLFECFELSLVVLMINRSREYLVDFQK